MLHRPDLELQRLTPANRRRFLFDDVLWVDRAREEHDAFAAVLRERGVEVLYVARAARRDGRPTAARDWVLDRSVDERSLGPDLAVAVREHLETLDPAALARRLIGGLTRAELGGDPGGLVLETLAPDDLVLAPLPNHLFTRDTSCWIYDGVSLNPMAKPARRRETVHLEAIYRFHPSFASAPTRIWYGGVDEDWGPASLEGGDVLVLGNRTVLVGMGERSTPMAVELLARSLFLGATADRCSPCSCRVPARTCTSTR